jgi:serine/tyrosine/threonine adenylyltransferase
MDRLETPTMHIDYKPSMAHADLGDAFFDVVSPAVFPSHVIRYRNQRAARSVGLAELDDEAWIAHFGRFESLPGSFPAPLALRYHGHQFGSYNPELGDGRGFLFAQLRDQQGRLLDLGTKGSGQTPWSRFGDGRLTLRGGVREVLATSMLEALGVDTSKSFSLIETGEDLERHDEAPPIRGAVLVRLSHSHIRIGSFQRLLYLEETDNIGRLLDYTIRTYMPSLWREEPRDRAIAFLEQVCRNVAEVGAQWMAAGFVHGVLNTDNINVTGESFDYGPWRFLPTYQPLFTAAYFDQTQRYAFARQPSVLLWNLTRLAECLLGLASQEDLQTALGTYRDALASAFRANTLRRLGVASQGAERDDALVAAFWDFLQASQAPFEQVFFDLYGGAVRRHQRQDSPATPHYAGQAFATLGRLIDSAPTAEGLRLDHPYFTRGEPCTMLIGEVDAMLDRIAGQGDWSTFHAKLSDIDVVGEAYGTT